MCPNVEGMQPSSPAAGPALTLPFPPAGAALGPAPQQQQALGLVPQPALSNAVDAFSPHSSHPPAPDVLTSPPLVLSQLPITFAAALAHQAVHSAPIPARFGLPRDLKRCAAVNLT